MEKLTKNLFVRLTEDMHRKAKVQSYKEGKSMQDWIIELIANRLKDRVSNCASLCQVCGKWDLNSINTAALGKCELCGKDNVIVYPCWETTIKE